MVGQRLYLLVDIWSLAEDGVNGGDFSGIIRRVLLLHPEKETSLTVTPLEDIDAC